MKKSIFSYFLFTCAVLGIVLAVFQWFFPNAPDRTWKDVVVYVQNSVTDSTMNEVFDVFSHIGEVSNAETFRASIESRTALDWLFDSQALQNAFRYFFNSGEMSALDYVSLYTTSVLAGAFKMVTFALKWVADFFVFLTVS